MSDGRDANRHKKGYSCYGFHCTQMSKEMTWRMNLQGKVLTCFSIDQNPSLGFENACTGRNSQTWKQNKWTSFKGKHYLFHLSTARQIVILVRKLDKLRTGGFKEDDICDIIQKISSNLVSYGKKCSCSSLDSIRALIWWDLPYYLYLAAITSAAIVMFMALMLTNETLKCWQISGH